MTMDSVFGRDIKIIRERMHVLRQDSEFLRMHAEDVPMPELFETLGTTLEELQVTDEELRQQSEELARARDDAEIQRQRYQALFELAPDGYIVSDENGIIREANRAAGRLFDAAPARLMDRPLAVFVPFEHRREFRTRLMQLQHQRRIEDWEIQMRPRNGGTAFPVNVTAQLVAKADRRLEILWLIRDCT